MNANPANTPVSQDVKKYSDEIQNKTDLQIRKGEAARLLPRLGSSRKKTKRCFCWSSHHHYHRACKSVLPPTGLPFAAKMFSVLLLAFFFSLHVKNCRFSFIKKRKNSRS
tara:strand:- start:8 stop:337 length:330 start_codon:yes stop_codon:yes gene_type:complete